VRVADGDARVALNTLESALHHALHRRTCAGGASRDGRSVRSAAGAQAVERGGACRGGGDEGASYVGGANGGGGGGR
jgi:hypothetical protein